MSRTAIRTIVPVAVCAALIAALTGCTPPADTSASPSASAPSPSASPEPQPGGFVPPVSCTALVGPELEATFLAEGNVLFSGTDGSGIHFPIESAAQDGGTPFSCTYGKDMVDLSTFELAVQPLTQEEHEGVLAELQTRGMVETTDGEVVTFSQEGTEGGEPAIVHALRPDSWISTYRTFGGPDSLAEISGWAETVAAQVYPQG